MRSSIKGALIALTLVSGALVAAAPAQAQNITVGVYPKGGIAFGYNDGYWDHNRQWHNWERKEHANRFRAGNKNHYYEHPQSQDRAAGLRADDRWWDHR